MYPKGRAAYLKVKKELEAEYGKGSPAVYGTLVSRGLYVPKKGEHKTSKSISRAQHGNVLSRFSKRSNRRGGTFDKFSSAAGAS
jgi:hypothetical protein